MFHKNRWFSYAEMLWLIEVFIDLACPEANQQHLMDGKPFHSCIPCLFEPVPLLFSVQQDFDSFGTNG